MKILYYHGAYPFCYYYRGYLPGVYSNQMVVQDFLRKDMTVDNSKVIEMAEKADVIVFQRPSDIKLLQLAHLLRIKGKKIIFENDDTYEGIPLERLENEKQIAIAREQADNLKAFASFADGVIASTETLKQEYAKVNPNTRVLKNCIDPGDAFTCKQNTTGKFRVGFIGSVTTNDDYAHIKDQIRQMDKAGMTIVVMGIKYSDGTHIPIMNNDYEFWNSLENIEWHPYCHITEYMYKVSQLALDVAIIPRLDHYFNRCKSNLKFLEMSLLKIPVIAQGFPDELGPYDDIPSKYVTLVSDNTKWFQNVDYAKHNHAVFKKKAEDAHDYVLEHYNIIKYATEWTKQIEQLCKFQQNI